MFCVHPLPPPGLSIFYSSCSKSLMGLCPSEVVTAPREIFRLRLTCASPSARKRTFCINLVNFARVVEFGKPYFTYNAVHAYCMVKYRVLKTLKREESENRGILGTSIPLTILFLNTL